MSAADARVRVFAYGSNLCSARLAARVGPVVAVAVGRLDGHALRFHKRSVDGSAKADAYATGSAEDRVWGAVYELDRDAKRELDRIEGLGDHYLEREVSVATAEGESVTAWVYVAHASRIAAGLRPYSWYQRFVVEGARRHGLPADYIAAIEAVESLEDPDRSRHEREISVLGDESA